ncbi:hypothetical protein RBB75_04650 [Tunturibacter empetritectus]|uniref:Uncharacterized protein n=1 Tax=Tunturiibacter empetritectus TaxID=3069691 RepID=A0AAU7ZGW9_9BACT
MIAWGLDEYSYRDDVTGFNSRELAARIAKAGAKLAEHARYTSISALLERETRDIQPLLATVTQREDLQAEYRGLDWMLGVVDLRLLLAFQRRLIFNPSRQALCMPAQNDWPGLISLTVGSQRSTEHVLVHNGSDTDLLDISLHSNNPDLQLRFTPKTSGFGALPLSLYGGTPFFEVAELRGRWLLRDGYHRAYHLLQAGVDRTPAVVIHTRSIEELGATAPWFFGEEQIFSDRPPRVTDFLDDDLILHYERTALRKLIRIRVEESLQPFDEVQEQEERL